jgi:hypothetical protein
MPGQRLTLPLVILLFAAFAFIANVLSPATPTPNAQGKAPSFLLQLQWLCSVAMAGVLPVRSGIDGLFSILTWVTVQNRTIIVLICVFLC